MSVKYPLRENIFTDLFIADVLLKYLTPLINKNYPLN